MFRLSEKPRILSLLLLGCVVTHNFLIAWVLLL